MRRLRPSKTLLVLAAALVLAGGTGFLASVALGTSQQGARTITINVPTGTGSQGPTGPTGPTGPAGPKGDPGGTVCPAGFENDDVVINHPGGQTVLYVCVKQ